MNGFINEHGTKLYGALTSFFGTVGGLVTTGAFNELLTKMQVGWLGIICTVATAVLGAMTMARGFNNTAQIRVAEAFDNALKAEPPKQGGFARPLALVLLTALAVLTLGLQGCTTNPDGSRELTESGKVALQEVAAIVVSRHLRESPRAAEHAQKIRTMLTELAELPDVTTVAALRQVVQMRIDERVSDPYEQRDYTRLLNGLSAVLSDYVGSGQLDALAVVKVRDFLGYVSAAIPALPPA